MRKTVNINIRTTDETRAKISAAAKEDGRSLSNMIERLITAYIAAREASR